MKQIHLSISEEQYEELNKLGEKLGGVSKNNLIRLALARLIHEYKDFK